MKRYIATLILATISIQLLNGAVLNSIKFQGDIDLITGEFNRERLLKVCHIEPPQFYEFWKRKPEFSDRDLDKFVERLERYAKSLGYYKVVVKSKIEGKRAYIYILKNEPIKIESLIIDSRFKRISLLTVGARFKTKNFTETKSRIERRLEESGYPNYEMRRPRAIV